MLDRLICSIVLMLLSLRYRIRTKGLKDVLARGTGGILFLPNHPALIDPVILTAVLFRRFRPSALADKDQIDRPVIRWFARRLALHPIPDIAAYGSTVRPQVERALDDVAKDLCRGRNMLVYPAGRVYRSPREEIGANSSVERILRVCPETRVVLVRTTGLWGSSFSWANGQPQTGRALRKGLAALLADLIFFAPRRNIQIEFVEDTQFPRTADRAVLNRYLEDFYNSCPQQNIAVPYTFWRGSSPVVIPQTAAASARAEHIDIADQTRRMVLEYLGKLSGIASIRESDRLAADLGLDSLARTDLIIWLEKEFGFAQPDADAMLTVSDVLVAATGIFVSAGPGILKPVPHRWFKDHDTSRITDIPGTTITEGFLAQAARTPSKIVIADQTSGPRSYRDLVTACLALKPIIESLEGDYVGIMFPASVAADTFYLAALFAGKIPVMINWTAGTRNVVESLNLLGVRRILTAQVLIARLAAQGLDLSAVTDRFVFAESLAVRITRGARIRALLAAYFDWSALRRARVRDTAAVLFTSGSETLPKAVPLTHANLLADLADVLKVVTIRRGDRIIGFLPPFHSFGLTANILPAIIGSVPTVYHANPLEAGLLARMINAYRVTLLLGTPTFLGGIVRVAEKDSLVSLRLAVTGAEKCPPAVYEALKNACPAAVILEGYGVTECSPIISLNDENAPCPGTIGRILPSLDYRLLDPETDKPVESKIQNLKSKIEGILCVAGPSVFSGYLNYSGPSPFVDIDGKRFYRTGDLVSIDQDGFITFLGRLKRFVKLGGEMISLPAIEAVLEKHLASNEDQGPVLAVIPTTGENPQLVLFTIRDIDRETVNGFIRAAGLSGLHNIRQVIKLGSIPTLGTGKTDYRALKTDAAG